MRPTADSVVYRPDLGAIVQEFIEGPSMGLIGHEVLPPFPVGVQAGTFPVIPKEALLSIEDTSRAPRGGYNRGDWEYENGKFATSEHGWEEPVDDRERKLLEVRVPGACDAIAVQRAVQVIRRSAEKRIAAMVFNESNFTPHTVSAKWDAASTGKPITDIKDGKLAFRNQCGMAPDALILSYHSFVNLGTNAQVVDQLKYTFPGIDLTNLTTQHLAQLFGVPRVLVAGGVYNSANKGLDASITDIWTKTYAALVKISSGNDLAAPGLGRSFYWVEDSAAEPIVEAYREEQSRSDVFRVRYDVDERLTQSFTAAGAVKSNIAAACMYLFKTVA